MGKRGGTLKDSGAAKSEGGRGYIGPGEGRGKGRGKGKRRDDDSTLPVVIAHMEQLLDLPVATQTACAQCLPCSFSRLNPAPTLAPLADAAHRTVLGTVNMDSLEAALELIARGWSTPAVLNMANCFNCGGAWCNKSGSQEEDLFRCSSLPLSLWPRRRSNDTRMPKFVEELPRVETIYPFSECDVIYSPHVLVCRSRDGRALREEQQFIVSVLSSAAQDLRTYKPHYDGPFDRHLNLEKMRSILWAAAAHGHDSLVLGAYGCGAFLHDPDVIAEMFFSLLGAGGEFEGHFRIVLFAIIKSSDNLRAFGAKFPKLHKVPACPKASLVEEAARKEEAEPAQEAPKDDRKPSDVEEAAWKEEAEPAEWAPKE